jgi:hypothetical protein
MSAHQQQTGWRQWIRTIVFVAFGLVVAGLLSEVGQLFAQYYNN